MTEPNNNKRHSLLINQNTGALIEVDSKVTDNYPHQVTFFPDGQYALIVNKLDKKLSTFLVDENSGNLKFLNTLSTGNDPQAILIVKN